MIADDNTQTGTISVDVNHVPLANRIASRLQRTYSWVGLDDLRSYAYLGMALAAKAYQSDRGVPFEQFVFSLGF